MPDEHEKKKKGYHRHGNMRHGLGSTTRLSKHKASHSIVRGNSSTDLLSEAAGEQASAPRMNRTSSKFNVRKKDKKPVIQLDRSDSDENEDYIDVDSDDNNNNSQQKSQPALQPTDQPMITASSPAAAKFTNETVLSVSDLHTAAKAESTGTFIDESDFLDAAVHSSRDDLASIIGKNSMRTQGAISRQKQRQDKPKLVSVPREGRVNEKVFKQYYNVKNISNPVVESLKRVSESLDSLSLVPASNKKGSSGVLEAYSPLAHVRKHNHDLNATTVTQLDGITEDTNFLLKKMWTDGWIDPDKTPTPTSSGDVTPVQGNIGAKARWAAQRLGNAREGIKLG